MLMGRDGSTQSQLLDLHSPEQKENVEPLAQKARKSASFSLSHSVMTCMCMLYVRMHVCAYACVCVCLGTWDVLYACA